MILLINISSIRIFIPSQKHLLCSNAMSCHTKIVLDVIHPHCGTFNIFKRPALYNPVAHWYDFNLLTPLSRYQTCFRYLLGSNCRYLLQSLKIQYSIFSEGIFPKSSPLNDTSFSSNGVYVEKFPSFGSLTSLVFSFLGGM